MARNACLPQVGRYYIQHVSRHLIERTVLRAGRAVRRMLRLSDDRLPAPALSELVPRGEVKPLYSRDYQAGTFVFEVLYITAGSGGLADILDLGQELTNQCGLKVFYRIPAEWYDLRDAVRRIQWTRPQIRADQVVTELELIPQYLCATAWPTAYRVLGMPSHRKLYFVQDYEPLFEPAGVRWWFAEQSYGLGLEMFTLGPWLAGEIRRKHPGSQVTSLPFPAVDAPRGGKPWNKRNIVAFYLQPEKAHRGSELLLESARLLAQKSHWPEQQPRIVLFGSKELGYLKFDFPCSVHPVLSENELSGLLAKTRVGISASFTNISLMPFRFVMHGAWSVELDAPNVRQNIPSQLERGFRLTAPYADQIATAVYEAFCQEPALNLKDLAAIHAQHSWAAYAGRLYEALSAHKKETVSSGAG